MDDISKEVLGLENILGLPRRFYNNLLSEDDWSFVIKLSALFEAASGQALAAKLKHSEIERALSYIEQAHPRYGKITLMFQLNIINKEQQRFLTKIAELRNQIVHNIKEVNFDLTSYIASMDGNQKKIFAKVFGHGINETFEIQDISLNRTDFTIENPKMAIWLTANEILACLHADIRNSNDVKKLNEIGEKLLQNITKKLTLTKKAELF